MHRALGARRAGDSPAQPRRFDGQCVARHADDGILEAVARFTGEGPQRDDFTLVTVKRV